jgi:hypothetical protein
MSKFWRGHPATPHQQSLPFDRKHTRRKQLTQADVLIGMLRDSRSKRIPFEFLTLEGVETSNPLVLKIIPVFNKFLLQTISDSTVGFNQFKNPK